MENTGYANAGFHDSNEFLYHKFRLGTAKWQCLLEGFCRSVVRMRLHAHTPDTPWNNRFSDLPLPSLLCQINAMKATNKQSHWTVKHNLESSDLVAVKCLTYKYFSDQRAQYVSTPYEAMKTTKFEFCCDFFVCLLDILLGHAGTRPCDLKQNWRNVAWNLYAGPTDEGHRWQDDRRQQMKALSCEIPLSHPNKMYAKFPAVFNCQRLNGLTSETFPHGMVVWNLFLQRLRTEDFLTHQIER